MSKRARASSPLRRSDPMPHFTLWFETEALRDHLLPIIQGEGD